MVNKLSNMKISRVKDEDFYETPENATETIIKYIPNNIKTIWEPCCGNRAMSKVFEKYGYNVISTDINMGEEYNFFSYEPKQEYDIIITNPPFSYKTEFLKRSFELNKPFILLLPITTLEGINRYNIFKDNKISLIVLNRRINFMRNKSNYFNCSWFLGNIYKQNKLMFENLVRS